MICRGLFDPRSGAGAALLLETSAKLWENRCVAPISKSSRAMPHPWWFMRCGVCMDEASCRSCIPDLRRRTTARDDGRGEWGYKARRVGDCRADGPDLGVRRGKGRE